MLPRIRKARYKKAKARERQIEKDKHFCKIANARNKQNKRAAYMKDKLGRGGQTNGIRF